MALVVASSIFSEVRGTGRALAAEPSASPIPGAVAADLELPTADTLAADAALAIGDVPEAMIEVDVDEVLGGTYDAARSLPRADWDVDALAASLGTDPRGLRVRA